MPKGRPALEPGHHGGGSEAVDPDVAAVAFAIFAGDREVWERNPAEREHYYRAARRAVAAVRQQDDDLLMRADSLLSLIRYREASGLSQQTVRDLDSLLGSLRRRTDDIARRVDA